MRRVRQVRRGWRWVGRRWRGRDEGREPGQGRRGRGILQGEVEADARRRRQREQRQLKKKKRHPPSLSLWQAVPLVFANDRFACMGSPPHSSTPSYDADRRARAAVVVHRPRGLSRGGGDHRSSRSSRGGSIASGAFAADAVLKRTPKRRRADSVHLPSTSKEAKHAREAASSVRLEGSEASDARAFWSTAVGFSQGVPSRLHPDRRRALEGCACARLHLDDARFSEPCNFEREDPSQAGWQPRPEEAKTTQRHDQAPVTVSTTLKLHTAEYASSSSGISRGMSQKHYLFVEDEYHQDILGSAMTLCPFQLSRDIRLSTSQNKGLGFFM